MSKKKDKKKDKKKKQKKEENCERLYAIDEYGQALRDMRIMRELNQSDIAEAAGVSQGSVSAAEHSSEKLSLGTLQSIADVLGCHVVITFEKK